MHSPILLLGSTVDEIWDASSAIDDIVSHYKGHHITFKKYHETGHMLTVAYQPIMLSKRLAFTDEREQGFLVGYDSFFLIGI